MGVSDAVRRKLPVEAEGLENEYTYSSYLCPSGAETLCLSSFASQKDKPLSYF